MQIFVKIGRYYFEISQFEKFVVTLIWEISKGRPQKKSAPNFSKIGSSDS